MADARHTPRFGSLLRRHRLSAGFTQAMLAERAGVAERTIQDLERGVALPRHATVRRLVAALPMPPDARAEIESVVPGPRRRTDRAAREPEGDGAESQLRAGVEQKRGTRAPGDDRARLPTALTSFVGRERELDELSRLLEGGRLLTLTGAGGSGKTRLALELAARVAPRFPDGVRFVSLAAVVNPAELGAAVAGALGVSEAPGRPLLYSLQLAIGRRRVLVVLDNFEHLLPGGALLSDLLASCPELTVLVTSRELLRLRGERVYTVAPLTLPNVARLAPCDGDIVSAVGVSEAVELFVDRAQDVQPGFRLTARNAAAVADVCLRLDGLPLAIELAAARVRHLAPEDLRRRLGSRLRLLTGGASDGPARQRTLRDTIAWSHDLLDEHERRLFRRLAVFVGGFTLEAAGAICDAEGDLGIDVLDGVASLIDKSLVRPDQDDGEETRYGMLETVREYALERLEASGESDGLRRRHAQYFCSLAERARPWLAGAEARRWLDRLQAEHDNLRAALRWGADTEDAGDLLARLAGAIHTFWRVRGHLSEARQWLDLALARVADPVARIGALEGGAALAFFQDDYPRAYALWSELAAFGRAIGDRAAVTGALSGLAYVARLTGHYEQAATLSEEAVTLGRQLGDGPSLAQSLHACALVAYGQGNFDRAASAWEESLRLFREAGSISFAAHVIHCLARVAMARGDLGKAAALFDEAIGLFEQRDDHHGRHFCLIGLMRTAQRQGEVERVMSLAREILALSRGLGTPNALASALEGLAWAARVGGDPSRAARLLGAAEALRETVGVRPSTAERAEYEAEVPKVRVLLGERAFAVATQEGRAMALEQAVAYAVGAPPT